MKYDKFTPEEETWIMEIETEYICEEGQVWHQAFLKLERYQYRQILAQVIPELVSFIILKFFVFILKIRDLILTQMTAAKSLKCGKKSQKSLKGEL